VYGHCASVGTYAVVWICPMRQMTSPSRSTCSATPSMGSERWVVGSGQWMQWAVGSRKRAVSSGQWALKAVGGRAWEGGHGVSLVGALGCAVRRGRRRGRRRRGRGYGRGRASRRGRARTPPAAHVAQHGVARSGGRGARGGGEAARLARTCSTSRSKLWYVMLCYARTCSTSRSKWRGTIVLRNLGVSMPLVSFQKAS
jgi:hypothetical protein